MLDPLADEVLHHPNVELMTLSEVEALLGRKGAFAARIRRRARRVDAAGCYGCAACHQACPVEVPSRFDEGATHKAIHIPYVGAVPHVSCVDAEACLFVKDGSCGACVAACPFGNIRLEEAERVEERRVGAVIVATGDEPVSMGPALPAGVVSAHALERLLNQAGPTEGIVRFPDGREPHSVALLRCARPDGTGPVERCSGLCCALFDKYAALLHKHLPEVRLVDLVFEGRRPTVTAGQCQHISLGPSGSFRLVSAEGSVRVEYQGQSGSGAVDVDLAVIAPPLVGSQGTRELAQRLGLELDADGFLVADHQRLRSFAARLDGVFLAGSAQGSKDVSAAATQGAAAAGAVLSALQPGRMLRLDPMRAVVDAGRCGSCGVCAAVCPYQAIGPGPQGSSVVDDDRCRGCGGCAASCPSGAIEMPGFTDEQIESEIVALLASPPTPEGASPWPSRS
jgi:heterodisulfide reductase subunit A